MAGVLLAGCKPASPQPEATLTVNSVSITREEVARELRGLLWRRSMVWESLDVAAEEKLRREAVDALVERRLIADFAARAPHATAITPAEAEAAFQQFIRQFEPPDHWKQRMELQGLTELQLRERLTAELAQTRAIESWLKSQRTSSVSQLDEAAAQKWFAAHRESMRLPERVRASHIFLTAHDVGKPDRTAEMAAIQQQLTAGAATLAQLAAAFSDDERSKKVGGDLGWLSRERVPEDFAKALFALPVGKPSPVFRTQLGWHIALVHEKKPARPPEFSEVKAEIMTMLGNEWRVSALGRLRAELRAAATIQEAPGFAKDLAPAPWDGVAK
ncbi:parvulin-like peptidyl-prolyl isomerase [Roseimicrobium gellanilyticum]|uniref:Parvulin-like peptidyl-prolyl isomerase n=1 Tax=Roseimicrobium gellanilyticum TaxID=748857 RepID=A0A366HSN3_9BACT|nr:peptidylprolyl isomerase [Roseimicrobium gellanilyticum]RBP47291.1 parvulin-like peptidyl-prolyl isomerase [Roseimicrobium gellanilyticum]